MLKKIKKYHRYQYLKVENSRPKLQQFHKKSNVIKSNVNRHNSNLTLEALSLRNQGDSSRARAVHFLRTTLGNNFITNAFLGTFYKKNIMKIVKFHYFNADEKKKCKIKIETERGL